MKNLLYFISLLLITTWAVGFMEFNAGGSIHFLLVFALILFITWAVRRHRYQ